MDKMREAFEKWADEQGWPPRGTAWRREGYTIWQASLASKPQVTEEELLEIIVSQLLKSTVRGSKEQALTNVLLERFEIRWKQ